MYIVLLYSLMRSRQLRIRLECLLWLTDYKIYRHAKSNNKLLNEELNQLKKTRKARFNNLLVITVKCTER